jgi:hypothetical protein
LPTAPHEPHPCERQCPNRHLLGGPCVAWLCLGAARPAGTSARPGRPRDTRLAQARGPWTAPLHPGWCAAPRPPRSAAGSGLPRRGCPRALPRLPAGPQKAWRAPRSCSWPRRPERTGGRTLRPLGHRVLAGRQRFEDAPSRGHARWRPAGRREDDARVWRQRRGALHRFQPLVEAVVTTNGRLGQALRERAAPGALSGFARRPPREPGTTEPGRLLGPPREDVRDRRLPGTGQPRRAPDAIRHATPTVRHQRGQGPPLGTLGHERLARMPVPQPPGQLEGGRGGLGCGPARGPGCTRWRPPQGLQRQAPQSVLVAAGLDARPRVVGESPGDGPARPTLQERRGPRLAHCWPVRHDLPCSVGRARGVQADRLVGIGPIAADTRGQRRCGSTRHGSAPLDQAQGGQGQACLRCAQAVERAEGAASPASSLSHARPRRRRRGVEKPQGLEDRDASSAWACPALPASSLPGGTRLLRLPGHPSLETESTATASRTLYL